MILNKNIFFLGKAKNTVIAVAIASIFSEACLLTAGRQV